MGLCKCEKRKVTNLFCFEHKVNVCDHCAVAYHKRCVIKSYLHWLQDSDYNPNCELCKESLADEKCGECVRLLCFDVFHWKCLDKWANDLPLNTAPAGFQCPICQSGIFPASNDMSPVAVALRQLLETIGWSRAGLGLPILQRDADDSKEPVGNISNNFVDTSSQISSSQKPPSPPASVKLLPEPTVSSTPKAPVSNARTAQQDQSHPSSYHIPENSHAENVLKHTHQNQLRENLRNTYSGQGNAVSSGNGDGDYYGKGLSSKDLDDESSSKYKRKSPFVLLARWLSFGASKALTPRELTMRRRRRSYVLLLLAGLILFTFIYFGVMYGRATAEGDPLLDPRANPHIRVNDEEQQKRAGAVVE